MSHIILAVDGGATKTALTIRTVDGQELFSATSTGSNYQAIGSERVHRTFDQLLIQASEVLAEKTITIAVFAIAGIDTEQDARIVREIVEASVANSPFIIKKLIVENDVEATLLGIANKQPTTLLISGTGAICFSFNGKEIVRTGGWGHRVGDEGSGYWLGQQVAKAIFRAADGREEQTILTDLVLNGHNIETIDALVNWLYNADYTNARLASFGSYIQKAVELGDKMAIKIAEEAANELALLATATLKKAGYNIGAHPFFINGGVLKNNPAIYEHFVKKVHDIFPDLTFTLCKEQPIEYIVNRALAHTMEN